MYAAREATGSDRPVGLEVVKHPDEGIVWSQSKVSWQTCFGETLNFKLIHPHLGKGMKPL